MTSFGQNVSDTNRAAQSGRWMLAVAIAGSALAVGTVHTTTLCIVTVVVAVAAALALWDSQPMSARPAATVLLLAGVALTSYTALQCVPMPLRWLTAMAPHNADVWSRALSPLHESGPRWAPISLDPTATRVEVLKGMAYLLAFVTALREARTRDGARFLGAAVVLTGLALAAAALLHPAFGAHRLFGVYEPGTGISERHIAPLMNPNNLAGYLNVALCLALAAMLAPEPAVPRPITGAIALLLGAAQVWVASRGGVVAMALGVFIVLAIAHLSRSRGRQAVAGRQAVTTLSLVAGVAVAAGAVMIALGGSDAASSELFETDTSKLKMFMMVMRMLPAVWTLGCGRGAFESAFPAFRADGSYVTYEYPENVVAQWLLEWGLPVGLAGLAALAFALRPSAVLARSATASGAWAALVALSVQNLGDLGSEVPGLALAAVICAAIVVAGAPGHRSRWRIEQWAKTPRRIVIAGAVIAAAGVVVAASGVGGELHQDQRALYNAARAQATSAGEMKALARSAMLRHPAEPYLPFIVALRLQSARDENPISWIGATLERATVYAPAHLALARTVAPRSPSQARLEYRFAIEQGPDFVGLVMNEASRLVRGYFDAMELVPNGKSGGAVLDELARALNARLPATSVRLDAELATRVPSNPEPLLRAAAAAVEDLRVGEDASWCRGAALGACADRALDLSLRAEQLAPARCLPRMLHASARVANGDVKGGLKELSEAVDIVADRTWCLRALVELAWLAHDDAWVTAGLDRVAKAGCMDDAACAGDLTWAGGFEAQRGNRHAALTLYKKAYERTPDDESLLERIAQMASAVGLHAESAGDYGRLARSHPAEQKWSVAVASERAAAMNSAMTP